MNKNNRCLHQRQSSICQDEESGEWMEHLRSGLMKLRWKRRGQEERVDCEYY
jgi:hypothetical protein